MTFETQTQRSYKLGARTVHVLVAGTHLPADNVLDIWLRPIMVREHKRELDAKTTVEMETQLTQCLQLLNNTGTGRFRLVSVTVT